MHLDSFKIPKTSSKTMYVTPCASLYIDAANCLSGDVGSSTKLVGVKTSPSHKVLSRRLNVVDWCASLQKIPRHFFGYRARSIAPFWRFGLEWVREVFDFYPPKLPLLKQRCWWCVDHFLLPWNELLLPTNFHGRKPAFFFFVVMSKKKKKRKSSMLQLDAAAHYFLTWRCNAMCSFHTHY